MDIKTLFGNDYEEFNEVDPFNPQNRVEGFISRKPNEFYGALVITKVNGKEVGDQLIYCTPKIHYPFDSMQNGSRKYKFPPIYAVEIYEKLDGTNVLSYFYKDAEGIEYLTFKTRLRPFLSSGRFGDFLGMWKELTQEKYDEIKFVMGVNQCNVSFEVYGSRNTHLIVYDKSLAYAVIFGVKNDGIILSPNQMETGELPVVEQWSYFRNEIELVKFYEEQQRDIDKELEKVDEYYKGEEGTVWYLHPINGKCLQVKCKPETIEAIHFAQALYLSKNNVIATCWNGFENVDALTVEYVSQLLLEEFEQHEIDNNKELIAKCIEFVTKEAVFKNEVIIDYRKIGINILKDKKAVMNTLSTKYPKVQMGKVYAIIMSIAK